MSTETAQEVELPDESKEPVVDQRPEEGKPFDVVEEASMESFPASDSPGWMFNDDDSVE